VPQNESEDENASDDNSEAHQATGKMAHSITKAVGKGTITAHLGKQTNEPFTRSLQTRLWWYYRNKKIAV
jgi:hypothetical protein